MTTGATDRPESRRVGREVALTFVGRLALTAAILLGDVLLARGLGPEGKGAFALLLNLTGIGALILGLGLERSLAVFAARSLETARRSFANSVLWSLLAGGLGVLAIVTGLLAPLLPDLTPVELWIGALALPAEIAFGIGMVGLLGRQRVLGYNVARFMRRGVLTALLIPFVLVGGLDLELVLVLNLAALAVTLSVIGWSMLRARMIGWRPDPRLLVSQLSFGGRIVVGTVAERLHFRANTFLINAMVSTAATGVLSVALALSEVLWYLPAAFGAVLFSRALSRGTEGPGMASAMTRTMLALMLAASVPLWLLAPMAVEIVYGAPFREAGVALQLMLPGVLAYGIVMVLANPIIAWGAPGRLAVVLVAGLAINLVATILLVPQLGMNGAAIASTISYAVTAVLTLLLYGRLSGESLRATLVLRRSDITQLRLMLRSGWFRRPGADDASGT